jgi:hypothetical protein
MVRLQVEVRQQILKEAAGGAMMQPDGTDCRWWQSEISVKLQVEQR